MPVKKRATNLPQFAELLDLFPCPAWVEDGFGRVLARNAHASSTRNLRVGKTTVFPLSPADKSSQRLRLVALFPDGREMDCLRRVFSAFLANVFQPRQTPVVDETLLTPRQRDIYREMSHRHCYKDIAANLGITLKNVQVQTTRMRQILGVEHVPLRRRKR